MAIDGYIVNVNTSDLKAVIKEMNAVGKNINQITRNANIYGIDQQDIDTLKARVDEIWQRRILLQDCYSEKEIGTGGRFVLRRQR
ncbi:MAG: MobC family plasmid mobilization relaxosome protein [Oscillospiraceae bacterium]|nr:MobC family plasmid mobilization relaxosome protein [Oscillospiraceae bacterium]